jgi:hypothetical protein
VLDDAHGTNMWAERNPHKAMQPVRPQTKPTDAQKIAAAWNKESSVLLAADVLILTVVRDTQIEELATKHNVTKQHVEKLVNNSTHYKKPCAQNLANTLVHMKANELNEGISSQSVPGFKLIDDCRFARGLSAFA